MSAKFDKTLGVLPYSADIIITIMEITKILKKGLARAAFIKLQPGGTITPHIDQGPFAAATERYHLPITTNPDCFLSSGGETAHAPAGELWYFNKHALHTATNGGSTDRVHLIIDVWK
jgi:aspartyl/asparaginyl beta-hydroxylase (cupin superfamily)